jgi:hypothetical protein
MLDAQRAVPIAVRIVGDRRWTANRHARNVLDAIVVLIRPEVIGDWIVDGGELSEPVHEGSGLDLENE